MSVTAAAPPAAARGSALGRLTLTELRLFARERSGPIRAVGLPLLLLIIFGSIPFYTQPRKSLGGYTLLDAYVPVLIAFSLAMLSLTALPMVLTGYREKGVLRRLQATPAGPVRVLAAQLVVNLAVAAVTVTLILAAWIGYGGFIPRQLAGFVITALLAAAALMSIGLFIAAAAPTSRAAQAIGMIGFYPMMFFAGLFYPLPVMPSVLRHISHATPLGAAVQALQDTALGHWPQPSQLLTMAAYAVVFGMAAASLFRWE